MSDQLCWKLIGVATPDPGVHSYANNISLMYPPCYAFPYEGEGIEYIFPYIGMPSAHPVLPTYPADYVSGAMYFSYTTLVQRLCEVMSCHPSFAASAFANKSNIFIPHPPHFLGIDNRSHFSHVKILPLCLPFHKNLQQRFWICWEFPLESMQVTSNIKRWPLGQISWVLVFRL